MDTQTHGQRDNLFMLLVVLACVISVLVVCVFTIVFCMGKRISTPFNDTTKYLHELV